jgi:hypothetical protein
MLRHHGRPAWESLFLPVAATLYLLMTVDSARQHTRGVGAEWKGWRYPAKCSVIEDGADSEGM